MKKLEMLNKNSMELDLMSKVKGGAQGEETTWTVRGDLETGETTVTNDGIDAEGWHRTR
jgi:hypothetical protein